MESGNPFDPGTHQAAMEQGRMKDNAHCGADVVNREKSASGPGQPDPEPGEVWPSLRCRRVPLEGLTVRGRESLIGFRKSHDTDMAKDKSKSICLQIMNDLKFIEKRETLFWR